jgi:hypothetical protein
MKHHPLTKTTRTQYWSIILLRVVLFVLVWLIASGIILALFPPDDEVEDDYGLAVGIQVHHSEDFDADIQRGYFDVVQDMGLQWIQQTIRWADVEPEPGVYDWRLLDFVLPITREKGLKALVSVSAAPDWALPEGVNPPYDGLPANMEDFAHFLTVMLERYPKMIHAVEVWPYPNLDSDWTTSEVVSPKDFVELLRITNRSIKTIDSDIIVISGALAATGGDAVDPIRAIDDFYYIDQLIKHGLLEHCDCVGAHPIGTNVGPSTRWDSVPEDPEAAFPNTFEYPHHAWSFRSTLETYAQKIATAGGTQQLCVTGFGWASIRDLDGYSTAFAWAKDISPQEQANWLVEALDNMEEWGFVQMAIIYNLNHSLETGLSDIDLDFLYSLITPTGDQRPAVAAIREWTASRRD